MSKRELSKSARFARMFKIWEYLKTNTDKEHPTTQSAMRKDPELADKELLRENLRTIQKAIDHNAQIRFQFNDYTYEKS